MMMTDKERMKFRSKYGSADPVELWNEKLEKLVCGGMERHLAARHIMRTEPELAAAYVQAFNEQHQDAIQALAERRHGR